MVVKNLNEINQVNRQLMDLQTSVSQKDRDIINLGKYNLKLQQQIQNLFWIPVIVFVFDFQCKKLLIVIRI